MTFAINSKKTILNYYHPMTGMGSRNGDVGLEIELEGDNLPPGGLPCKGWEVHMDNSLRGPKGMGQGGAEYTSRGPISLVDVRQNVTRLQQTLNAAKVIVREDSPRTSTHIHVNVQQMSFIDVFGYIILFAAVEPLFLHLCGPRRDGNSFCVTSFDSGDLPDWFHEVFRVIDAWREGEFSEFPHRGKYASLGTFRMHDLGTLEARCFPCSLDPEQIHTWCTWLLNIKDMVQRQEDKSFRSLIKLGLHDPQVLIQTIFGETGISPYLAAELVQYGSREAYELTRLTKFFLNKKPDEKKKKKSYNEVEFHEQAFNDVMDDMAEPVPMPRAPQAAALNWADMVVRPGVAPARRRAE